MAMRLKDRLLWGLAVGGEIVDQVITGGSRAYHKSKWFLWTPPRYTKKRFQGIVNRLEREGLVQKVLIEGIVHYRLAGLGRKQLIALSPALQKTQEKWDGFWRIVMFDVPESKRRSRDVLRKQLNRMSFGRLQHSTYVSAFDYGSELLDFLQKKGLWGSVLLMEAKQKHLGRPQVLASKVWNLDQLAGEYNQVIDRLTTRFGIRDEIKREEFLKKVYQQYLLVLVKDPFLPKELLPSNWPAEKARRYVLRSGVVKD